MHADTSKSNYANREFISNIHEYNMHYTGKEKNATWNIAQTIIVYRE